ncbi:unnamed protein product [Chondrus crispus]|uniref:Uncharacterized protein n=1 Tax=Chondrus crispus TaxID=2769 RepID=R7QKI2_CHOCR|nr:unnamed protein product [Chondrus crispus]CDF39012.1 unnamed protein product [Chondrus crispus]|eukprot:XP_005718917.1 unnamed protein product [Chondrus crispus]
MFCREVNLASFDFGGMLTPRLFLGTFHKHTSFGAVYMLAIRPHHHGPPTMQHYVSFRRKIVIRITQCSRSCRLGGHNVRLKEMAEGRCIDACMHPLLRMSQIWTLMKLNQSLNRGRLLPESVHFRRQPRVTDA